MEIELKIKSEASANLANGYIRYVCTDTALLDQGGYETWAGISSLVGAGPAPAMEALVLSLLKETGDG